MVHVWYNSDFYSSHPLMSVYLSNVLDQDTACHELQIASQTGRIPLLQEFVQPLCYGNQCPRPAYSKVAYQLPEDYLG
jgi:hypothetical protein